MEWHLTCIYKSMFFFSYLLSVFPYNFELFVNFYDMHEICSCLGSLLCPDLGKFCPQLAVSWFLCRQFTCDFNHWLPLSFTGRLSEAHHKLGLLLPVIQVFSCFETGVSCIYQTVPVWCSAFMKFFCVCRHAQCVCGNMFSYVSVCKCTWVYTIEAWTYVCRLEVHLV